MNTRPRSEYYHLLFTCLFSDSLNLASHNVLCCRISEEEYVKAIKEEIKKVVDLQEELDIDVLVHGEPEVRQITLIYWQS